MKLPHPNPQQKAQTYQVVNIVLFVSILLMVVINALIASRIIGSIRTSKQQYQTELVNQQAAADQAQFFANNSQIMATIDQALPSQSGVVSMIEQVEALQQSAGVNQSFTFTSSVPSQENNQYYLPFTIKINANMISMINFLRQFEKLPYLTKITTINIKSPTGLAGTYEISIAGRVYVQDAFKN